jgi:hypothetical protein
VDYTGNILLPLTCDTHVASVYIAAPTVGRTHVSKSDHGPMAMGCFICVNINIVNVLIDINSFVKSRGILFKMLVLGINEIVFAFPLKF